jgi:hypothetical protein
METADECRDKVPIVAAADDGRRLVFSRILGITDGPIHPLMPEGGNPFFSLIKARGYSGLIDDLHPGEKQME